MVAITVLFFAHSDGERISRRLTRTGTGKTRAAVVVNVSPRPLCEDSL